MTTAPVDLLAPYHAQDSTHAERVIPLLDDEALCRLVVAWSLLPVSFAALKGKAPADERERWAWLWGGCAWGVRALADASGLAASHVLTLHRRAVAGRLIYPDGTISAAAESYLKAQVVARLAPAARAQAQARRPRPEQPDPPARPTS